MAKYKLMDNEGNEIALTDKQRLLLYNLLRIEEEHGKFIKI